MGKNLNKQALTNYTSVSILISQKKEIEELIFKKDWLGFRSISEFVREAIRKQIYACKMEISAQDDRREKEDKDDFY